MSDIRQPQLNRRQLLKGGLALAAGFLTLGSRRALGADRIEVPVEGRHDCTRWAFLSDTHIAADPDNRYRGFYPYRNLLEMTGQIAADMPDGCVVTGDLARLKGRPEAYDNLKALLTPIAQQRPIYLGLGNHDNRGDFFQAFANVEDCNRTVENRHVVAAEAGPIRLIVLDSLLFVNRASGILGDSQRAWLQALLQTCDDRPTILFLHHTPNSDLLDTRRLFEIIRPEAKVKAVVYGHSHKYRFSEVAGIHLINLPAAGYNLSSGQPVGWVQARLTAQGGEFTLHAIGGNRKLDGHTHRLTWRA